VERIKHHPVAPKAIRTSLSSIVDFAIALHQLRFGGERVCAVGGEKGESMEIRRLGPQKRSV
jgi:hypothetical protein